MPSKGQLTYRKAPRSHVCLIKFRGIGDKTVCICHETSGDHVMKVFLDSLGGYPLS